MMFEHSTYIFAAYGISAVILACCALAPVLRAGKVKARLAQSLARREGGARQ